MHAEKIFPVAAEIFRVEMDKRRDIDAPVEVLWLNWEATYEA
jgi:hypothetical protein